MTFVTETYKERLDRCKNCQFSYKQEIKSDYTVYGELICSKKQYAVYTVNHNCKLFKQKEAELFDFGGTD